MTTTGSWAATGFVSPTGWPRRSAVGSLRQGTGDEDEAWCLDTLKHRPKWFTDDDLFDAGLAPNDDSYRGSGFDRGHLAMKLLVERLGQDAAYCTHTVLNAIPQRPNFNRGIWQNLELLTGAWAQVYGRIWVIQGTGLFPGPGSHLDRRGRRTPGGRAGCRLQDRPPQ